MSLTQKSGKKYRFAKALKVLYILSIDYCKNLFAVLHVFRKQYVMFPFVLRKCTKIVEAYRKLVVGENGKLVVEFEGQKAAENLSSLLSEKFGCQILLTP